MSAVALATRGYVCPQLGDLVSGQEPPDFVTSTLQPSITGTQDTETPEVVSGELIDLRPEIKKVT